MYTDVAEQWLRQHAALEPTQQKFLQKALYYYQRFAGETSRDPKVRLKTAMAWSRGVYPGEPWWYPDAEAAYRRAIVLLEPLVAGAPLVPEYRSELANIQTELGSLLNALDQYTDGEHVLRSAIALGGKLVADYPSVPRYQSVLALSYQNLLILRPLVGGSLLGSLPPSSGRFAEAEERVARLSRVGEKLA